MTRMTQFVDKHYKLGTPIIDGLVALENEQLLQKLASNFSDNPEAHKVIEGAKKTDSINRFDGELAIYESADSTYPYLFIDAFRTYLYKSVNGEIEELMLTSEMKV